MLNWINNKITENTLPRNNELSGLPFWRQKIYYTLNLSLLILGGIAYFPSVYISVVNKLWEVVILDTVVYAIVILLFFLKGISFSIRSSILLGLVYLLGVALLILLGPVGAGWVWLFAFPVFASILAGFRAALICIFININTLIILGFMIQASVMPGMLISSYNLESWAIVSINFICLNGLVSIPLAVLLKALQLSLNEEKRVKDLLNEEQKVLYDRNKDLKRINNDLDNFVYTASHDLKAPISNLEGLLTMLELDIKDLERKETNNVVQMMKVSVDRFKVIIGALAEVSKVQKNIEETQDEIMVKEVLEDVKFNLTTLIQENKVQIHVELKNDVVRFSQKNLFSILYNLISNAIKYKDPERTPEVWFTSEISNGFYILTVTDNGLGMKEDFHDKIFRMFKRMHDHVQGTGVGLYIVKRIVENYGGRIEVQTELGVGSTFRIFLPTE